MIEIIAGVHINPKGIRFQAVRSSGPGGQHVNKVSSKVVLMCPLKIINGLNESQLRKIKERISSFVFDDTIKISSSKHRSQYSNKIDAQEKLKFLLKKALKENKKRRPTQPSKSAVEKRLQAKAKRSDIKKSRKFDLDSG